MARSARIRQQFAEEGRNDPPADPSRSATFGLTKDKFTGIVGDIQSRKDDVSEANGHIGAAYKNAEDVYGVNRKALQMSLTLYRMQAEKQAEVWRELQKYCTWLGIGGQLDIFEDAVPSSGEAAGGAAGEKAKADIEADPAAMRKAGEAVGKAGGSCEPPVPDGHPTHGAWVDGWTAGQASRVTANIRKLEPITTKAAE